MIKSNYRYRYINIILLAIVIFINIEVIKNEIFSYLLLLLLIFEIYLYKLEYNNIKVINDIMTTLKTFKINDKSQKLLLTTNSDFDELVLEINFLLESYERLKVDKKKQEDSSKKLLSNLSHDIRTPLTSIIGYADALNDGIVTNEKEKKEFIGILSNKSKNLKELINQIFNIAKIDSDDIELNFEKIELNEFLRNTIIDFVPQLEKYNIEFINEIKEKNFIIYADRIALSRIFQNIIKNAIQHGREGNVLGIRTRVSNEYYRIVIWDKGKGIPKDKQKYIFERLFKVDDARKIKASSSGLGMSIAKKLIEKHNGNIFLRSEKNSLTEFFIELPILKKLSI